MVSGMKADNITTKCLDNPPAVIKFQKRLNDLEGRIDNPVPNKTVAIIAMGPLNEEMEYAIQGPLNTQICSPPRRSSSQAM